MDNGQSESELIELRHKLTPLIEEYLDFIFPALVDFLRQPTAQISALRRVPAYLEVPLALLYSFGALEEFEALRDAIGRRCETAGICGTKEASERLGAMFSILNEYIFDRVDDLARMVIDRNHFDVFAVDKLFGRDRPGYTEHELRLWREFETWMAASNCYDFSAVCGSSCYDSYQERESSDDSPQWPDLLAVTPDVVGRNDSVVPNVGRVDQPDSPATA